MSKATEPFHAYDEETARSVFFAVGAEVPDAIAATVGAHVLDKPVKVDDTGKGQDPDPGTGGGNPDPAAPFNPSGDGVTAKAVKEYLAELDVDTEAGLAEYNRVVEAEKAGQNRSSAIPS